MWSFVGKKEHPKWLWLAICRQTRPIIAHYIGDRNDESAKRLYERMPEDYKKLRSYSDFWDVYTKVFSKDRHRCVDKRSGQTNHVERFNLTLRQRLARYVRKTLSFSKRDYWHGWVTKLFIIKYNRSLTFS